MSDHIPDVTKMISDTPMTDERSIDMYDDTSSGSAARYMVATSFARQLERELNEANKRIERLEEAGDAMEVYCDAISAHNWNKAKEYNP